MHITTAINTTMRCTFIDRAYELNTVVVDERNLAKVKPCCYAHWGLIPDGVKTPMQEYVSNEVVTNNPVIEWFRDVSKTGILPKSCKSCTTIENKGGKSPRITSAKEHEPEYDVFMLDVHTGNECNLACAMCNSYSSSLIGKETLKYGNNVPSNWRIQIGSDQNSTATFAQVDQIMKKHSVQIVMKF